MATVARRNQGKTDFVKDVLKKNRFANSKIVNEAWVEAGREGTISETLVNKMRSELGLTGNLRRSRSEGSTKTTAEKPMYTGKKRGRKPKSELPSIAPATSNGRHVSDPRVKSAGPDSQLASLEADLDIILFKVMNLGGLEEIESSLRCTRRLLYKAFDRDHA